MALKWLGLFMAGVKALCVYGLGVTGVVEFMQFMALKWLGLFMTGVGAN